MARVGVMLTSIRGTRWRRFRTATRFSRRKASTGPIWAVRRHPATGRPRSPVKSGVTLMANCEGAASADPDARDIRVHPVISSGDLAAIDISPGRRPNDCR